MAHGTYEGEEKALKALVSGLMLPLSKADREDGFSLGQWFSTYGL